MHQEKLIQLTSGLKRQIHTPAIILIFIIFFYQIIFLDNIFYFRDIHRWFYPMKYYLASSIQNGVIPLWCSHYFCGAPFISDLQSGVFYPLSYIFLLGPTDEMFNIYILIHFLLGFLFFRSFLLSVGLSSKTALFAGSSYCFGGYAFSSINTLNNLSTMIWLPAVLWAITEALNNKRIWGFFWAVIFSCMSILGGEPQLFLMTVSLLFLYSLVYNPNHNSIKSSLNISTLVVGIILVSILITLIQLGPAYMDYRLSVREGGMSYIEATRHSLLPGMLKHLILPVKFATEYTTNPDSLKSMFNTSNGIPWLLTIYPGFLIIPLAFFGIIFNYSKKLLFWVLFFLTSLILALGSNTPVYSILFKIIPFFRYPEKFVFLASFSLVVSASYGFEKFLQFFKDKSKLNLIFYFLLLILATDLYYNHKHMNPLVDSDFYQKIHPDLNPILEDNELFRIYVDENSFSLDSSQDSILKHHLVWQQMLFPNVGILKGVDQVNGTTGLELIYQYTITEILERPWAEKIDFMRMANVKYIISASDLDKVSELDGRIIKLNPHLYMIKGYLPRAWIAGELHPVKKGTMDELLNPGFDYVTSAITNNKKLIEKHKTPYFKKTDRIKYMGGNKIVLEAETDKPGVLILSESSYPGWRVFVDGKEKPCLWLNLLFQGVELDKGVHRIEFVYHPDKINMFTLASVISILLFAFIWLYTCVYKKSRKSN